MNRNYLLCFHDFSVWNYETITPILRELRDLAGSPFSVLVIPGTEGASEEAIEGFRKTLAELKDEGFELALHGYMHKAEFSQGRSYAGLAAMVLTNREAEFAGLTEYESSRVLQQAISAWDKLMNCASEENDGSAIRPSAFIPPTWYSNKFLPRQVKGAKMTYESRFALTNTRGKKIISPVASFAGIPKNTEKMMMALARTFLKLPVGTPRVALHPCDFPHLRDNIRDLIRIGLSTRKIIRYSDL